MNVIRSLPLRLAMIAVAAAMPLRGQESARPSYDHERDAPRLDAVRIRGAIRVDGRLDEDDWSAAASLRDLRQLDPREGQPVSERTEIHVLFDAEALYIGARMYDREMPTSRLGRRDMTLDASDWLGIIVDSRHDHRTAFAFEVNPAGVRRDRAWGSTGDAGGEGPAMEDDSWEPIWDAATMVTDSGWFAEIRIPLSQLRFSAAASHTWGLQVERRIARTQELAFWPFTPRDEPAGIPRFGHLTGITEVAAADRLELVPYAVARAEYIERPNNPFRDDDEYAGDVGLDLKARLSGNMTLDATLNPDFGQVEVDAAVVNLTAFETFFPEKRPFFVEGSELFRFGTDGTNSMFYSRRIGRQPTLRPLSPLRDVPAATRILGAAKVTGRIGGGWAIGALNALTRRERARFQRADGTAGSMVAEPLTNYFVARARREGRGGQTALGGFAGAVHRDLENDVLAAALPSQAYSGGIDFSHQWAGRTWTVDAFLAGSHVRGDRRSIAAAQRLPYHYFQRPDAAHIELDTAATSLGGFAGSATITHRAGRHWSGRAFLNTVSPGYEIGDLGFQRRADRVDAQLVLEYRETRPASHVRQWSAYVASRVEHNYDGDNISDRIFASASAQFTNYWTASVHTTLMTRPTVDDRLTRGGPAARRPSMVDGTVQLATDARAPLVARFNIRGATGAAVRHWSLGSVLAFKPWPSWELSLSPALSRDAVTAQYLRTVPDSSATHTFGARYVFAALKQTVFSLETRVDYTFTPSLSLQAYLQPFIASGSFGSAKELEAPRTFSFLVYGRDIGEVANDTIYPSGRGSGVSFPVPRPDFTSRSFRGNAVLRWEWRPGSTLYLAWQQARADAVSDGDFDLGAGLRALSAKAPDNVLLLKVSYWLNP